MRRYGNCLIQSILKTSIIFSVAPMQEQFFITAYYKGDFQTFEGWILTFDYRSLIKMTIENIPVLFETDEKGCYHLSDIAQHPANALFQADDLQDIIEKLDHMLFDPVF